MRCRSRWIPNGASGLAVLLTCALHIAACTVGPNPPSQPDVSERRRDPDVAIDPGVVAEIAAIPIEPALVDAPTSLAACGPGSYVTIDDNDAVELVTGSRRALPTGLGTRLSDLACPISPGLLVAGRSGAVAWLSSSAEEPAVRLATGLARPRVALGPADELWLWQATPPTLVLVRGSEAHTFDVENRHVEAVVGAAVGVAAVVTRSEGSSTINLAHLDSRGGAVLREIASTPGPVAGAAVVSGGRVLVADPTCIRLVGRGLEGSCVATVPTGPMSSFGDEVAVLAAGGTVLHLLRLLPAANRP